MAAVLRAHVPGLQWGRKIRFGERPKNVSELLVRTFNVDRVPTFKRKSRQNAPIVKTLARMRPHDTR